MLYRVGDEQRDRDLDRPLRGRFILLLAQPCPEARSFWFSRAYSKTSTGDIRPGATFATRQARRMRRARARAARFSCGCGSFATTTGITSWTCRRSSSGETLGVHAAVNCSPDVDEHVVIMSVRAPRRRSTSTAHGWAGAAGARRRHFHAAAKVSSHGAGSACRPDVPFDRRTAGGAGCTAWVKTAAPRPDTPGHD